MIGKKKYQTKSLVFLFFIFSSCFLIFAFASYALDMESSQYQLKYTNVNITSGNKESASYKLSDTVGQLAAGEFSSTGYVVKAGFQYFHSITPFRFTISNTNIDLGTLLPSTPATETTTLTVHFGGAGQYQVTAIEEGALKTLDETSFIPDTSCDGGASTCTETLAKPWTLNSAYGFGYNMSGDDIPSDFVNSTYFRPFPDRTVAEPASVVMSSTNVGKNRQSIVTFKTNISNIQPAGTYQTIINFVATPGF